MSSGSGLPLRSSCAPKPYSKKTRGVGDGKRGRQRGKNNNAIESSDDVSKSDLVSESDVEGKAMSVDGEGTNTVEEGDYVGPGDVEKSPVESGGGN